MHHHLSKLKSNNIKIVFAQCHGSHFSDAVKRVWGKKPAHVTVEGLSYDETQRVQLDGRTVSSLWTHFQLGLWFLLNFPSAVEADSNDDVGQKNIGSSNDRIEIIPLKPE